MPKPGRWEKGEKKEVGRWETCPLLKRRWEGWFAPGLGKEATEMVGHCKRFGSSGALRGSWVSALSPDDRWFLVVVLGL